MWLLIIIFPEIHERGMRVTLNASHRLLDMNIRVQTYPILIKKI